MLVKLGTLFENTPHWTVLKGTSELSKYISDLVPVKTFRVLNKNLNMFKNKYIFFVWTTNFSLQQRVNT